MFPKASPYTFHRKLSIRYGDLYLYYSIGLRVLWTVFNDAYTETPWVLYNLPKDSRAVLVALIAYLSKKLWFSKNRHFYNPSSTYLLTYFKKLGVVSRGSDLLKPSSAHPAIINIF